MQRPCSRHVAVDGLAPTWQSGGDGAAVHLLGPQSDPLVLDFFDVYRATWCQLLAGSLASPAFRTTANLENVLRQSIVLGLVTIGQTFVLISGGIDISVGSIVKLNVLIGALITWNGGGIDRTFFELSWV